MTPRSPETDLPGLLADGGLGPALRASLAALDAASVPRRLWARDPRVWREDPREIADRLGWLTIAGSMRSEVPRIRAWRTGLAAEGVRDVVLLGMGGSSLAPEVFRRTFPAEAGGTRLHVLDSTSPAWIRRVTAAVDPRALHVLVASKSGTTIEIETLYAHFRELVRETEGDGWPRRFTAITDPGTVLAQRAGAERFHAAWLNPADIGGRFSALSFFGLVPGAVLGIDLEALLARAEAMGAACGPDVPAARNPGAVLGAFLAAGVRAGRDRMTLLASRSLAAFGLWVEQLLAESTGKDGTGIVPIVDEPDAGITGSHRMFVALEDPQDDSRLTDALERVRRRGDPLLVLPCTRAELGAEMFRWEFATAVAGHLLGIHPFDQPDVQSAKTRTGEILGRLEVGTPGSPPTAGDPLATLRAVRPGDWVGLMVYGDPTAPLDDAVRALRIAVRELFDAATTLGLGPRFLHSTGQLHKGGADRGVFLQILLAEDPLPIPGRSWGFDQLIRAQADGDLEALRERGRRVARLEADDPAAAVRSLAVALRG